MAEKIATYEAKDLALHPSNIGSQAAQTAARRINSASEESARAIREVAENQEQVDRAMGQTQAEFLRFEALEQKAGTVGVKYGGGLKDMFLPHVDKYCHEFWTVNNLFNELVLMLLYKIF